jgi:hypothetical protein
MKKEPTREEKIRTLQAANPKLSHHQACQLLGYKDVFDFPTGDDVPDFLKDIFNISDENGKNP